MLFPGCRGLEEAGATVDRVLLLTELEHDHADVGETLSVVRDLAGGYRHDRARCGTHRALVDGLRALEHDLHQHIHEENNVLFPRVRGLLAA